MSIRHFNRVIQTTAGDIITGVSVAVTLAGTAIDAALFSDVDGVTPLANPFTNNATYGTADFYVEDGTYDLVFTKVGYTLQALLNWTIGAPLLRTITTVETINNAALLAATDAIPAGARVYGVFVTNTAAFGATKGLTGYNVGDGTTLDMWGANGITLDAVTTQAGFHSGDLPVYATTTSVVLSGIAGVFDDTGEAQVEVVYSIDAAL